MRVSKALTGRLPGGLRAESAGTGSRARCSWRSASAIAGATRAPSSPSIDRATAPTIKFPQPPDRARIAAWPPRGAGLRSARISAENVSKVRIPGYPTWRDKCLGSERLASPRRRFFASSTSTIGLRPRH